MLDDLGLSGGLASLARSIPQVPIDFKIKTELADTRLPDHIELALYRIAQECLQNVVKHAKATRAQLTFAMDRGDNGDVARLEIIDDGIGFDTLEHPLGSDEMGGYGLLSMAERAEIVGGRLNIRSRPGTGTAVTATIPIPSTARLEALEIARAAAKGLDRLGQRARLLIGDPDVGEHVVVQRHGRIVDGRAAQPGDLHQRGAAVGGVRQPLYQAVGSPAGGSRA